MPDSYTSSNRLTMQEIGANESTWGNILNTAIECIDTSLDGQLDLDVTLGDITLTANNGTTDQARNRMLNVVSNTSSNRTVVIPDVKKMYLVKFTKNDTGNLTIRNVADGTGVTLSDSFEGQLWCDGVITAEFNPTPPPTPPTPITTILEAVYPVGSLYINVSDSTDPAVLFGFGTWVPYAQGRTIIGVGTGTDINLVDKTFLVGSVGGEYEHVQTVDELANHRHNYGNRLQLLAASGIAYDGFASGAGYTTTYTGNSQPMQWLPPYITTFMWQRTA